MDSDNEPLGTLFDDEEDKDESDVEDDSIDKVIDFQAHPLENDMEVGEENFRDDAVVVSSQTTAHLSSERTSNVQDGNEDADIPVEISRAVELEQSSEIASDDIAIPKRRRGRSQQQSTKKARISPDEEVVNTNQETNTDTPSAEIEVTDDTEEEVIAKVSTVPPRQKKKG